MRVSDKQRLPPGFRFHPTDEELILYYLKRKICKKRLKLNLIGVVDVYKWDPEEIPRLSMLKTGDRQWFFFSPRDRKYPNGARTSRGAPNGYWKATGKDRIITCNSRNVGIKKTLVFYRGRAPSGQRTDWVMHEYTLDEDELKRCQNAQDSYALYKIYKKSGPGPKNGEQYGAPFREEEWAEDEQSPMDNSIGEMVTAVQQNEVPSFDKVELNHQVQSPLSEIEEMMKSIMDEPELGQQQISCGATVSQVAGEVEKVENQSAMVNSSFGGDSEVNCLDQVRGFIAPGEQCYQQANFDFTQTAPTMQFHESSEVTSVPNDFEPEFFMTEEDFLEFDDLVGPELNFSSLEKPPQNLTLEDFDGLSELDLYQDAAMFLNDIGSTQQGDPSQSCITFLQNDEAGQMNYQLQPQIGDLDQIGSQIWMHDQQDNLFMSTASIGGTVGDPASGVVNESSYYMNNGNQDTSQKDESGGATSRFSSALWAFVDSIPSNPASAAENALVNRAFERMSSFSRLRISSINNKSSGDCGTAVKKVSRSKGLFLFSVIGAVCAISWVLVGSIDIWGRFSSL